MSCVPVAVPTALLQLKLWARRIEAAYTHAYNGLFSETLEEYYSTFFSAGLEPQVLADIIIQMACIFEAVHVSTLVFDPEVRPKVHIGITFMWAQLIPHRYRATIVPGGWCPAIDVGIIARDGLACILGYARTLKSPQSRSSVGHGASKPESCVVNTRDTTNNPPKHVSESCECNNSMPLLEDVKRFLQNRKIPAVDWCPVQDKLRVKDSSSTPFVAISHVWAACKNDEGILKDLGKAGNGAFWIDTLCIPEMDDMKHRATWLMAQTDKEAEAVVVIDSGIQEISSSALYEEKLFNVLYSRWMQRLWTFQETAMAKKLYFEFSDGLVSLDELVPIRQVSFLGDINPVLSSLFGEVWGLLGCIPGDLGLVFVSRIFRQRSLSKPSDELLAVCSVLNLDGFELARISNPEERMVSFLQIGKLPSLIIFDLLLPCEWRLDKEGFRWAPKTFMRGNEIEYVGFLKGECDVLCTSTSLEAEYVAITQGVVLEGEKGEWYFSHLNEGRTSICKVEYFTKLRSVNIPSCNAILLDARNDGGFPAKIYNLYFL
uniref:Heterokaryon incompatibility domain-containing protein n=1 Tax=Physcomitrium patens TaxID=3218 RepID=A0A2K1IB84_PHYPA|nr:hypothetical protein PHYPA_031092 [Physcomitrium patens]